jgi:trimeric autotransporter adhesin
MNQQVVHYRLFSIVFPTRPWQMLAALMAVFTFWTAPAESTAAPIITTVAGRELSVQNQHNMAPSGIAVDAAGNTYVADSVNNRIRKFSPTGLVTNIAGDGASRYNGDGVAKSASLNSPSGLTLDAAGNLFIADRGNNRIRKITLAGVISTVAGNGSSNGLLGDGGPAMSATLFSPEAVAILPTGALLIADTGNHRLRHVALDGTISTYAGTGVPGFAGAGGSATSAQLDLPSGLAVKPDGTIYVSEFDAQRVRVISGGIISAFAGNGTAAFAGDGGAATNASLHFPRGLAVDASGNVLIADSFNGRVRSVATNGVIRTLAGSGSGGFDGDGGAATSATLAYPTSVAVGAGGNVFIGEVDASRVRRVAPSGVISTVADANAAIGDGGAATDATLGYPYNVAVDGAGNIYIADYDNARVRKTTKATGGIATIAGTGVWGYSGDGGLAVKADLKYLSSVTLDAAGDVYIADAPNSRVRKVTVATGVIATVVGSGEFGSGGDGGLATNAQLGNPLAIVFDSLGNMYIVENYNARVRKVTASTGVISTVAGTGTEGFSGDGGLAVSARLYAPRAIAIDRADNLYISDSANNRVRKVDATTGVITTIAGNGATDFSGDDGLASSAGLSPIGIALDAFGNLYIADASSHRVRRVDAATGVISTVVGNGASGFAGDGGPALTSSLNLPFGVAFDVFGDLYIADLGNNRIRKVTGLNSARASNDLSGDLKSDLIFNNTSTGEIAAWLMNGPAVSSAALLLGPGAWTTTHTADLNGDGRADILLRNNSDGTVVAWLMNGLSVTSGTTLLSAGSGWSVSHTGDFNGDGKADILLRHTDGRIVLWLMSGGAVTSGTSLLPAGTGFSAVHVADFNGDGKADILLRNTNDGTVVLWTMNGGAVTAGATILNAGAGYTPTHTGDFNGDGKADILWRSNTDGSIVVWLMNGSTVTTGAALIGAGNWYVNQVADFNGDGKSDILLRNADGTIVAWIMNGSTVTSGSTLFGPTTAWAPTKTGDYNGDGKADIIMRNNDGTLVMWLMNGGAISSGNTILGPGFWNVGP